METAGASATLDESHDGVLVAPASATFGLAFLATDKSLVNFDHFASTAHWLNADDPHGLADAMPEEPSGLHAAAKHSLDLPSRNAFLAGAHQVDDLEPQVQRQVAILEKGAHADRKGLLAGVAFVEARARRLAIQRTDARRAATERANGAVRPKPRLNVCESASFGQELGFVQNGLSHGY
jgi:hypothetical protein